MQPDISPVDSTIAAFQATRADEQLELSAEQEESEKAFIAELAEEMPVAVMMHKKHKKLEPARQEKVVETSKAEKKIDEGQTKDAAAKYEQKNSELKAPRLLTLKGMIKEGASQEEILKTVQEFYPDPTLADEVLDFLIETSEGELAETLKKAKEEFTTKHGRDIEVGKHIADQVKDANTKGLGTPTDLRDLYRNLTANPKDSNALFDELSKKYSFKDLKNVSNFLLHSLGADLKAKGTFIQPGQLHVLMAETRALQAMLHVYRFFDLRMGLVNKLFKKEGLAVPQQLNFENLAKQFMELVGERYPSAEKVLQRAVRLGIDKWIMAKIIAFSQLRDAIREMAVNQIYRSVQHRDELYMAILEALEDLEEELEELLDQADDDFGNDDFDDEGDEESDEGDEESDEESDEEDDEIKPT